ncbi:hypothetical protein AEAC466_03675 [Asticcacaulis sp. AC466]|uniref:flagellar basal body rod C-terminal domain-containing protein n=1 Tax=Asticcacaulis sp. AC466 TaxID=1282362 RepID=UPI0003C3D4EF|nr:flagellar basal body rod C-terminal domain-containing protein [Asticcacaulis sp. AC466]ESQ86309.1 hypothetical protein AEAC466_03675 [Asticcacaulis sp. AC466]
MSAISSAYSGVYAANQRFEAAAANTVRDASSGGDIVSDVVGQIESRTAFEASISVAKTADEMMGRLLDIKA